MGKRTEEEKKTSKVTPAAGGDCAKLFAGGRGTSFANNTRDWWEEGFGDIGKIS